MTKQKTETPTEAFLKLKLTIVGLLLLVGVLGLPTILYKWYATTGFWTGILIIFLIINTIAAYLTYEDNQDIGERIGTEFICLFLTAAITGINALVCYVPSNFWTVT